MKSRVIAIAVLAVMLLLAACQQTTLKPVISSFTATPATVAPGGSVTLSWKVSGATKLNINNGVGDVTGKTKVTVKPTKTTTYTLTATNSGGNANKQVTVTVNQTPKPTISSFKADPTATTPGGTVTLSWTVTGATKLMIDNNVGDVTSKTGKDGKGSVTVKPTKTTTYTLTATNGAGSVTAPVKVNVGAAPTISAFTANPDQVASSGGTTTLSWTVTGATKLVIDNNVGDVTSKTGKDGKGSTQVQATKSTTFTLTASNDFGSVTAQASVAVGNAPMITAFTADKTDVTPGTLVTLNWTVIGNGVTLTLDPGAKDETGKTSDTVTPTATTTYTLTAENTYGTTSKTVTVTVGDAPTINSFTAQPSTVYSGAGSLYTTSTLSWDVSGADTVGIDNSIGSVSATGTQDVTPSTTTTYTLTATNTYGSTTATATVTATAFAQVFSDTPDTVGGDANFGLAVAVDGDTMVVGAPFQATPAPSPITNSGMAYVYTYDGTSWSFATALQAGDAAADDNFGTSVAIRGGTILVGAPGHAVMVGATTHDRAGAVYVFTGSGSNWTQSQELTEAALAPTEVQTDDQLGFSVALNTSGDTFVAGANQCAGTDDIKTAAITISPQALGNCEPNPPGTGSGPGKAYVFTFNGTSWAAQQRLDQGSDSTSADGDDFGYSVSITTDSAGTKVVAVGSHGNAANGKGNSGAVYLFTYDTGTSTWPLADKLTPGDAQAADYFGRSVSLSGDTLLVGSVIYNGGNEPTYAGAAYVYDGSGGWSAPALEKKLTPDDAANDKFFGYYVALDGDIAVIGSQDHDTANPNRYGSVYVFQRNAGGTDNWGQTDKLTASDPTANAQFDRVAVSSQTIVVGAPTQTVNTTVKGEVYVFTPTATP